LSRVKTWLEVTNIKIEGGGLDAHVVWTARKGSRNFNDQ
jgi:hypothetical protein